MRTQQMTFASVQFRHKESHLKCFFSTAPPYSELRIILHTSVTLQRWLSPRQPLHSREGPRGFLWPRDSRSAKEIKKKKKKNRQKDVREIAVGHRFTQRDSCQVMEFECHFCCRRSLGGLPHKLGLYLSLMTHAIMRSSARTLFWKGGKNKTWTFYVLNEMNHGKSRQIIQCITIDHFLSVIDSSVTMQERD